VRSLLFSLYLPFSFSLTDSEWIPLREVLN
jgi:hypothetical protein